MIDAGLPQCVVDRSAFRQSGRNAGLPDSQFSRSSSLVALVIIVLPVFLLLAIGFLAVKGRYLDDSLADALNAFAVRLAVPALLFNAMASLDLKQAFQLPMLLAFYSGAFASFAFGILLSRLIFGRRPGEAVAVGFTAMFSNTVLLGLPIIERAHGEAVLVPAFAIIALHAPCLYIIGIATMEWSRRDGRSLRETVRAAGTAMFANSLMIAIVLGLFCNLVGFVLPAPLQAAVDMLAAAAIPAALVGIGAAMSRYQVKAEISESLMVAGLALVMHPLLALAVAHWWLALPDEQVRAAVLLAAMPPGMNVYIFAAMYQRAMAMSATAIVLATALSVITIAGWIAVLNVVLP